MDITLEQNPNVKVIQSSNNIGLWIRSLNILLRQIISCVGTEILNGTLQRIYGLRKDSLKGDGEDNGTPNSNKHSKKKCFCPLIKFRNVKSLLFNTSFNNLQQGTVRRVQLDTTAFYLFPFHNLQKRCFIILKYRTGMKNEVAYVIISTTTEITILTELNSLETEQINQVTKKISCFS